MDERKPRSFENEALFLLLGLLTGMRGHLMPFFIIHVNPTSAFNAYCRRSESHQLFSRNGCALVVPFVIHINPGTSLNGGRNHSIPLVFFVL